MQKIEVKVLASKQLPSDWFKRQQVDQKATEELEKNVKTIITQVKENGDKALLEFALKFDKAKLTTKTLKAQAYLASLFVLRRMLRGKLILLFLSPLMSAA